MNYAVFNMVPNMVPTDVEQYYAKQLVWFEILLYFEYSSFKIIDYVVPKMVPTDVEQYYAKQLMWFRIIDYSE